MGDRVSLENQYPPAAGARGPTGATGPSGSGPKTATADMDIPDGGVVKRTTAGHVTLATGSTAGSDDGVDGVAHPAALSGATVTYYPSGQDVAVVVAAGNVYRATTGLLASSVPTGNYTKAMGYSDGTKVAVLIGEEFPAP